RRIATTPTAERPSPVQWILRSLSAVSEPLVPLKANMRLRPGQGNKIPLMPDIVLQQALYRRSAGEGPRLRARSPGFAEAWLAEVERMLHDFGERPAGVRCPHAVFAQPLAEDYVAVVQVADLPRDGDAPELGFHLLVLPRK